MAWHWTWRNLAQASETKTATERDRNILLWLELIDVCHKANAMRILCNYSQRQWTRARGRGEKGAGATKVAAVVTASDKLWEKKKYLRNTRKNLDWRQSETHSQTQRRMWMWIWECECVCVQMNSANNYSKKQTTLGIDRRCYEMMQPHTHTLQAGVVDQVRKTPSRQLNCCI